MAEAGGVPRGTTKRELWRRVPALSPSGTDLNLHTLHPGMMLAEEEVQQHSEDASSPSVTSVRH